MILLTAYFMQGGIMGREGIVQKAIDAIARKKAAVKEGEKQ